MLLAFTVCCLWFQLPGQNNAVSTKSDREAFVKDSLRVLKIDELTWEYYHYEQTKKYRMVSQEQMEISKKWMDQSLFFRKEYLLGQSGYSQSFCMEGYYDKWHEMYEEATLELAKITDVADRRVHWLATACMVGIGFHYAGLGDLEKALEFQLRAQRMMKEAVDCGQQPLESYAYMTRHVIWSYYSLDRYQISEELLYTNIKLAQKLGDSIMEIYFSTHLTRLYTLIGATEKAARALHRTTGLAAALPRKVFLEEGIYYEILEEEVRLKLKRGRLRAAIDAFESATKRYGAYGVRIPPRVNYQISSRIAEACISQEMLNQASYYHSLAREAWLQRSNKDEEAWLGLLLQEINLLLAQGNFTQAVERSDSLIRRFLPDWKGTNQTFIQEDQPVNPILLKAFCRQVRAHFGIWEKEQTLVSARSVIHSSLRAMNALEQLLLAYSDEYSKAMQFSESKYIYELPLLVLFEQYQKAQDPETLSAMFGIAEKSKALQLLASIKDREARKIAGVPEALMEKERNIRKQITVYKKRLAELFIEASETEALVATYQQQLGKWMDRHEALMVQIEEEYPSYYKLAFDLSTADLNAVKNNVLPHESLLSYFWGADHLIVFGIRREEAKVWQIELTDEFRSALQGFQQIASTPPTSASDAVRDLADFQEYGALLYQKLLEPGLSAATTSVTLIPDGPLQQLPWVCLPIESSATAESYRDLQYLFYNYDLRMEYSCTLLSEQSPKEPGSYHYLGYAPGYSGTELAASIRSLDTLKYRRLYETAFREGFQPLKYNLAEVQETASLFKKGQSFTGEAATESAFKKWSGQGQVLHLAMHAKTNDLEPMLSFLAFDEDAKKEEDGMLHAYELYNMNIGADLTVLSACNTGAGKLLEGQGVMSLARAFRYAGSNDVLMTLWAANDKATYSLVTTFFKQLRNGESKPVALQEAFKEHFEQPVAQWMHPFYWSNFMLVGKGEPLSAAAGSENSFWWLHIIWIVGIIIIGLLVRTRFFS